MHYSLGQRHLNHASHTRQSVNHPVEVHVDSIDRIWDGETYSRPEHLDEYSAISGDDLARIAAFEPKREPSLWADVLKEGARHVRSAA